ncbi:MAG TPA: YbaL family putative K(+) efflux transporter [Steroidobacteraceae bacterium]|nr:YbaL family putative K(+) efflux transporter [Steroidobacteraceae bacterium]
MRPAHAGLGVFAVGAGASVTVSAIPLERVDYVPHHVPLIATIAVGLAVAFLLGFLASRLRLPPIIGYLLAGIVVGPFTPGFVADMNLAPQLAELGVILLMFGVGMHFSIADLLAVRRIALPGAIAQILVATVLGALVAVSWGWPLASGIVFGLALSVASTVVLLKALEQRGQLDTMNGHIAVGWLVVEDLASVVTLIVLPVIATSLHADTQGALPIDLLGLGKELGIVFLKIGIFFAAIHFVGVRVFPWLFAQVAHGGSRELITLFVITVALGIAYLSAVGLHVSFALGAFFAGVLINESKLTSRIAAEAVPLENAFSVLFFVSVGMLFDPRIVIERPLELASVVAIVVLGKSLAAFLIVLTFRYPLKTALTVSASLAQIGEFSFIVAAVGVSLQLLPVEGQNLILAGALLSITLNPLFFKLIEPLGRALMSIGPVARTLDRLARAAAPETDAPIEIRDHVILVGYGRVGSEIGRVLKERGMPFVVIEQSRERVDELRGQGIPVVRGDGAVQAILERARPEAARMLVVATPDAFQARRMLEHAGQRNAKLDSVVRTHSEAEAEFLHEAGFGTVLMAERELADQMSLYVTDALARRAAG